MSGGVSHESHNSRCEFIYLIGVLRRRIFHEPSLTFDKISGAATFCQRLPSIDVGLKPVLRKRHNLLREIGYAFQGVDI